MTRVFLRHAFADEHMAQVAITVRAAYFGPRAIGIGNAFNRSFDLLVEAGPTTSGMELVVGPVEFRIAAFADVGALLEIVVVLAAEGRFGTLVLNDVSLFFREFIE